MVKLSIIIVSYNVKDFLVQCLNSIYRSEFDNTFEIIVIDNDSFDGTSNEIKRLFPDVKYIQNENNEGFSKAVNKAINKASGQYICLLNPDVIVNKNCLSQLMHKISSNKDIGCIGPKILNSDGTVQHSCKRSFPTPMSAFFRLFGLDKIFPKSKFFSSYNLTYLDSNKTHHVDSISGAFMMFPKKILDLIGIFDERFFMFAEDIDFCHRIKDAGFKVIYFPKSEIIHYKGESVKSSQFDMVSVFYESMELYFNKYSKRHFRWKLISSLVKIAMKFRKFTSYAKIIFSKLFAPLFDTFFIFISFSLSIYFWYSNFYFEIVDINKLLYHWPLILNFIFCWYIASYITQFYKKNLFSYTRLMLCTIITFLISSTTTYFLSFFAFSRGVLIIASLVTLLFAFLWRFLFNYLYVKNIILISPIKNFVERRALIIGLSSKNTNIKNLISKNPYTNINIIGFTDTHNDRGFDNFLGKIKDIKNIVVKNKINELIVNEEYFNSDKIFEIVKMLKGNNVIFKIVPQDSNIMISKGQIEQIGGVDLLTYEIPFLEKSNIFFKRFFDIVLSFFLIIVSLPFYLFFISKINFKYVWGIGDEKVKLYYIKTNLKVFKFIPSFYNVLKGEISFVGSNILDGDKLNPNHILKPGLISLYNVKRFKNNDQTKINSYYIKNQSLSFDIEIMIKSLLRI